METEKPLDGFCKEDVEQVQSIEQILKLFNHDNNNLDFPPQTEIHDMGKEATA